MAAWPGLIFERPSRRVGLAHSGIIDAARRVEGARSLSWLSVKTMIADGVHARGFAQRTHARLIAAGITVWVLG